jgi:hypothetical protein
MSVEEEFKPKRPFEMFGLTEKEQLYWRVSHERFPKRAESFMFLDGITDVHYPTL